MDLSEIVSETPSFTTCRRGWWACSKTQEWIQIPDTPPFTIRKRKYPENFNVSPCIFQFNNR